MTWSVNLESTLDFAAVPLLALTWRSGKFLTRRVSVHPVQVKRIPPFCLRLGPKAHKRLKKRRSLSLDGMFATTLRRNSSIVTFGGP
jgi:hypothetical protein